MKAPMVSDLESHYSHLLAGVKSFDDFLGVKATIWRMGAP